MQISGMIKSTLVDFPKLLSCVLFVPGCNYDCFFCHNRTLITGEECALNMDKIDSFLRKRVNFLDGVVISGGEPTLQPGLIDYMKHLKTLGYKVKLDTNGSQPEIIQDILNQGLCDYFAVDYKCPESKYTQYCGKLVDAEKVLHTINLLNEAEVQFEVRTTVFPQLTLEDLKTMAHELPIVPKYILNKYNIPENYRPEAAPLVFMEPHNPNELKAYRMALKEYQPNIESLPN